MRLITRADFDGLACGTVLMELGIVDSWLFVHPKDMQDGLVEVTENDVLTNVPFVEGCGLWFDHHSSEKERVGDEIIYNGASYPAPSCARIIFDFYNGREKLSYLEEMISAVDKVDSGRLSMDEIINPKGWVLLGFIMDPRTGLGRFINRVHRFHVSNMELMEELMNACREYDIEELLMMPNVAERIEVYWQQNDLFKDMILKYSVVEGDIIITDLRGVEDIYTGNRFVLYSMFPQQNISIWIVDGHKKEKCIFAVGYSIVNRTATVNVGRLMFEYGGGGHFQVGTCQVPYEEADNVLKELIEKINAGNE